MLRARAVAVISTGEAYVVCGARGLVRVGVNLTASTVGPPPCSGADGNVAMFRAWDDLIYLQGYANCGSVVEFNATSNTFRVLLTSLSGCAVHGKAPDGVDYMACPGRGVVAGSRRL